MPAVFERIANFRDLGGLTAADGRRIRPGLLFRCADLSRASDADCARLRDIGVRVILDLRSAQERSDRVSRSGEAPWPTTVFHHYERSGVDLKTMVRDGLLDAERLRETMIAEYRAMPAHYQPAFELLFAHLERGDMPLLFHCAAGKDRTGAAAALLLSALGVDREQILADYLQTNEALAGLLTRLRRWAGDEGQPDDRKWRPLAMADADYLQAFLDTLDHEYGGPLGYLHGRLGFDAARLDALRTRLLEPAAA